MELLMIGILAKILGSGDVVKQGMSLIDEMHTSTEEEVAVKSKAKTDLLAAYAPFKLAQRYLALMFAFTFLLCFAITLGMTLAGRGDIEGVKAILGDFWIGEIMLIIVGFYFGGGLAESVKAKK
jgi:hypothetical protein